MQSEPTTRDILNALRDFQAAASLQLGKIDARFEGIDARVNAM
ncbi:MAG: hypothetical protein ACREP1_07475 [Rhodanobacteraceae bacterium]